MYPYNGILILSSAMEECLCSPPPGLYVEALISNVRKLGDGAFDREVGLGDVIKMVTRDRAGIGALLSKVKRH